LCAGTQIRLRQLLCGTAIQSRVLVSRPLVRRKCVEIDMFAKIERLAELQQKGILSPDEFADKKAELLSRL